MQKVPSSDTNALPCSFTRTNSFMREDRMFGKEPRKRFKYWVTGGTFKTVPLNQTPLLTALNHITSSNGA
ncbi:hypothetical protein EMIT0P171_340001 [Pseudomonas sp. IT-P171]